MTNRSTPGITLQIRRGIEHPVRRSNEVVLNVKRRAQRPSNLLQPDESGNVGPNFAGTLHWTSHTAAFVAVERSGLGQYCFNKLR
jgi:hypothetical protein